MTKQTDHDLLIEIKSDIKGVNARLSKIEGKQSCDTNREKIKTLERITWGTLLTAATATVKAFWPS